MERLLSLVSITILARLLTPEQFGLVATAGLIVSVVNTFFSFGFDWALVRSPNITPQHYSTAWTLRVLSALACGGILAAVAVPTGMYFRNPQICWVVLLMAGTILIGALENPALAEFRRNMDFRPEFVLRLVTKVVGFLVAVVIAWRYRTFWALPISVALAAVATVFLSYRMHNFRPSWRVTEWRELLGFSVWILTMNLLELARTRIADAFVARQLGARAIGVMSLAQELSQLAVSEVAAPINRAAFSRYSAEKHDLVQLREGYLKASGLIWMACLPIALTLLANADLAVQALFGSQWGDATAITMILLIGNLFAIFSANAHYVFLARGGTRFLASLTALSICVSLVLLIVLVPSYGMEGAALAYVVGVATPVPILLARLFSSLQISVRVFMANVWRPLLASLVIPSISVILPDVDQPDSLHAFVHLAMNGTITVAFYIAAVFLLWIASGRPAGTERIALEMARSMQLKARAAIRSR